MCCFACLLLRGLRRRGPSLFCWRCDRGWFRLDGEFKCTAGCGCADDWLYGIGDMHVFLSRLYLNLQCLDCLLPHATAWAEDAEAYHMTCAAVSLATARLEGLAVHRRWLSQAPAAKRSSKRLSRTHCHVPTHSTKHQHACRPTAM